MKAPKGNIQSLGHYKERNKVEDERFNMNKIEELISYKEKLDEETLSFIKSIQNLEKIYNSSKEEIKKNRRMQLNRIGKEFLISEYGRRYNVKLETIISAIVGEDNTNSEVFRQMREQKVI